MTTAELDTLVERYEAIQIGRHIRMTCLDCHVEGWTKPGNISYRCKDCKMSRYTLGLSDLIKKFV